MTRTLMGVPRFVENETRKLSELPMALSLEQVQQRFESWRQRRKKRTHIPQSLWKAAVALSMYRAVCVSTGAFSQ